MSQRRATISRSDRGVVGAGEAGSLAIRLASRGVRHRPFSLAESLDAARVIARDWRVDSIPRSAVVVGIMLDLRPADLTPSRDEIARTLGVSRGCVDRAEILWEIFREDVRLDLVRRAVRVALATRGSA
jgi:hypothetical protein